MRPIFITGTGTDVGKTVASAIVTEALQADYWKPVQAGYSDGTDSEWVRAAVSNPVTKVLPETYRLRMPASPHIAAREEGTVIELDKILADFDKREPGRPLVIEGAGGLMVPLNAEEQVLHLIRKLNAGVVLVSRNYLGSINHSLLTAAVCRQYDIPVCGWIFNDTYLNYEEEIAAWSGFPVITCIPYTSQPDKAFIRQQASLMLKRKDLLC